MDMRRKSTKMATFRERGEPSDFELPMLRVKRRATRGRGEVDGQAYPGVASLRIAMKGRS